MDNIQVNGVAVTDANFNDTTPAASAGRENLLWQRSGSGPDSVSAQTSANIPIVLNRAMTDLTVVNTTTETSIFSFSVPANAMSTNRTLLLILAADYIVGLASIATLRLKFGAATIFQDAFTSIPADADRRALFLEFLIGNQGATNDQTGGGFVAHQSVSTVGAPTTGIAGDLADASMDGTPFIASEGSQDTTAAQTLDVTWQWTTADAGNEFRRRMAILQLV